MLEIILNGIFLGSIYGLTTLGLSLSWGAIDILNWAMGDFAMIGAYVTYFFLLFYGCNLLNFCVSVVLAAVITFFLSFVSGLFTIRPLEKYGSEQLHILSLITTLGLSYILQNFALIVWGGKHKGIPMPISGALEFFDIKIGYQRVVNLVIALVLTSLLYIFLNKTKTGVSIQAIAQDSDGALLVGINASRTRLLTFALSSLLGGVSGALLLPIFSTYPTMGNTLIFRGFCIAVLGGLGSMKGALIGGILLGITESLCVMFIASEWKDVFAFLFLIVILVFRPRGLFGRG